MDEKKRETLFDRENHYRTAWDGVAYLVEEAHDNAMAHGFYHQIGKAIQFMNDSGLPDAEASIRRDFILAQLAKIGSEAGEAVDALQHNEPEKMLTELADIVIRVLDLAGYASSPQEFAGTLLSKMIKNVSRPYLHGKCC